MAKDLGGSREQGRNHLCMKRFVSLRNTTSFKQGCLLRARKYMWLFRLNANLDLFSFSLKKWIFTCQKLVCFDYAQTESILLIQTFPVYNKLLQLLSTTFKMISTVINTALYLLLALSRGSQGAKKKSKSCSSESSWKGPPYPDTQEQCLNNSLLSRTGWMTIWSQQSSRKQQQRIT